jgi:hypothetical protein
MVSHRRRAIKHGLDGIRIMTKPIKVPMNSQTIARIKVGKVYKHNGQRIRVISRHVPSSVFNSAGYYIMAEVVSTGEAA